MNWYVLKTKPHKEKLVIKSLQDNDCEYYFPIFKCYKNPQKYTEKPLISSYIFVKSKDNCQLQKLEFVVGSKGLLRNNDKVCIVKQKEIDTLKIICNQSEYKIELSNYKRGDKITIKSGAFKGIEGVIDRHNKSKITVNIIESFLSLTIDLENELI